MATDKDFIECKDWSLFHEPRPTIMPLLIWAVVVAIAIGSALYAAKVIAAPVYKGTGDNNQPVMLRLSQEPCTDAKMQAIVSERVRPEMRARLKTAVLTWGGRTWASCWLVHDGIVYSIDEEGAPLQPIPMSRFVDDSV